MRHGGTALAAALTMVVLAAPSASAQRVAITDPAGDGANAGLDIVRAAVDNRDDRVVARVRFVEDVRGDLIVSIDRRRGTGLRLVSEHRPDGPTTNSVVVGAFTDRPAEERGQVVDCPGFRVRWLEDRPVARMVLPSSCWHGGDYGALRFAVLTERGGDTDYAPGTPTTVSAWLPRG